MIDWRSFRPFLPPFWTKACGGSIEGDVHTAQQKPDWINNLQAANFVLGGIVRARSANERTRKLTAYSQINSTPAN